MNEKSVKIAALYIATLKAISLIHQANHWLSKGNSFYGDHLLFERIYNSALEDLDSAAEKMVGLFGEDCLNCELQNKLLYEVLSKYQTPDMKASLMVEEDFILFSQKAYDLFDYEGTLSLGLDDLLMATANSRETSIYLLQQALDIKPKE